MVEGSRVRLVNRAPHPDGKKQSTVTERSQLKKKIFKNAQVTLTSVANSPGRATRSHWLPGNCRSERLLPAAPVHPMHYWVLPPAHELGWFLCCTPPSSPLSPSWPSAAPSAGHPLHSGKQPGNIKHVFDAHTYDLVNS